MEIEGGGSGSAETLGAGRGKKQPYSPRCDEDSPKSSAMDADDEWLVNDSDSGSEEGDDYGNQRHGTFVSEEPYSSHFNVNPCIDLYIKGYPRDHPNVGQKLVPCSRWHCSFASGYHGADEEVAELGDFGAVSVKVTWRSHRKNIDE